MLVFVDESGFYLLPDVVRTYAPQGQTPLLRVHHTRDHLSVMSGITQQGKLFTLIHDHALTGSESVLFVNGLHRKLQRKLLVIWDGSPIHRSGEVKDFLGNDGSRFVTLNSFHPMPQTSILTKALGNISSKLKCAIDAV